MRMFFTPPLMAVLCTSVLGLEGHEAVARVQPSIEDSATLYPRGAEGLVKAVLEKPRKSFSVLIPEFSEQEMQKIHKESLALNYPQHPMPGVKQRRSAGSKLNTLTQTHRRHPQEIFADQRGWTTVRELSDGPVVQGPSKRPRIVLHPPKLHSPPAARSTGSSTENLLRMLVEEERNGPPQPLTLTREQMLRASLPVSPERSRSPIRQRRPASPIGSPSSVGSGSSTTSHSYPWEDEREPTRRAASFQAQMASYRGKGEAGTSTRPTAPQLTRQRSEAREIPSTSGPRPLRLFSQSPRTRGEDTDFLAEGVGHSPRNAGNPLQRGRGRPGGRAGSTTSSSSGSGTESERGSRRSSREDLQFEMDLDDRSNRRRPARGGL
ncbi:hypothetical protein IE81DRAFT_331406 [Ceraceosorus guamensis]|uniref:Uncharacterized protein n=1 Tax=Ceraceosorus guamensis TaxID=1522189 RepID=A0A316VZ18_9BASI|nr:hypothetical protein IE81DRAFT_331406 [Ceraceosorus guamensis]PWN40725.1 hypothetical protein IE81DRAFT_331406 [Ceraceosorus guamensis]